MLEVDIKKNLPGFAIRASFSSGPGVLGMLGPSGCGKSMTLKCIAGLVTPDAGRIMLNRRVLLDTSRGINVPPQERRVGMLFQHYALFPHLTVKENVAFGLKHLSRPSREQRVEQLLALTRLSDYAHRLPHQLSGGQQQRVALARALAPEPELLLLDEPFAALDSQVKGRLERELMTLQPQYMGMAVMVSHNLEEVYRLCSRIAVFADGTVLQVGDKEQVVKRPASRTVARIIGVKNLFEGILVASTAAQWEVDVPELGVRLKVRGEPDAPPAKAGGPVVVGIRPADILVEMDGGDGTHESFSGKTSNYCAAHVVQVLEGIDRCTIFLRVAGGAAREDDYHLQADLPRGAGACPAPGQQCRVYLPPDRLMLLEDR
ncbi:MAG: sulfate/molybdate ABC transporter ATP-binding protein [Bacillota bacterium]